MSSYKYLLVLNPNDSLVMAIRDYPYTEDGTGMPIVIKNKGQELFVARIPSNIKILAYILKFHECMLVDNKTKKEEQVCSVKSFLDLY